MIGKAKKANPKNKDPIAGCVLTEQVRRGKVEHYSYTPNGLPKLRTKSVMGWSPFFEEQAKTTNK